MRLTPTQHKDLRPMKAEEIIPGGTYYLKTGDDFERCCWDVAELKKNAKQILAHSKELEKEKRLFVRISAPWKSLTAR